MYDPPWLQAANDRLWSAIRDALRATGPEAVPDRLDRDRPLDDLWRDPGLILAQTCGLPLVTALRDTVRLVATPCYDLPGCDGPLYRSLILVQAGSPARAIADLRGARAAINSWNSQSGMNALRMAVAPLAAGKPFFSEIIVSGAHQHSIALVGEGAADVAAIDCVTHGLLAAHDPAHLRNTRVLCRTPPLPGLPLITAATTPDTMMTRLAAALETAMTDPALAETRAALHLRGLARLSFADYAPLLTAQNHARTLGYPPPSDPNRWVLRAQPLVGGSGGKAP